LQAPFSHSH